ncbi:D-3-phosphoglycerate dehydrogenase [Rubellimicrobium mesophilum DSM 19309]|uniref:D-3-phosphoglycerate dehydrogenase n=1 Tax=Rubellimicrobium mesophilum DSM 19309 TaxID=442562 RepID=A0A017HCB2_9RHOB|nr:NAD(P)-dependent oxidoreductase [Rubellimicrobium mesophilum]EYD72117.1 D-3-phosphoglycerate dehydrogenase [Rubellimicrobium mesophilum DSM 19309]
MSTDQDRSGPVKVLFAARDKDWEDYREVLPRALAEAGVNADLSCDHPPQEVDWIVYAPGGTLSDFSPYARAKGVLSLWAGVERIVGNPTLTQPLARMVDSGLRQGMVEWVVGQALRHHLGLDRHVLHQDGVWRHEAPKLATDRPVTVLGLGELGLACALALAALGFPVTGWSRRPTEEPRLARTLSGADGLAEALRGAEIVVLLLPLTPDTENLMDADRLALPARGFVLLNPGRGALIDDAALLAALDSGQVGHATLDVFRQEPLPPDHPFWAHPRVTVTPHIAAETRPATAARVIAENVRRGEAGEPLLYLVDRGAGY